jgi:transcriptional regulator with XRE-family HTH domain
MGKLRNGNVIGRNVARFRYQAGWTQEILAAKIQLLGGYMTRDIVANIESRRSIVTDKQIEFFTEVFRVEVWELFPQRHPFKRSK